MATKKLTDDQFTKKVVEQPVDDGIIDLDLSAIKKKKFRINGDNDKILALNTSDMHILARLEEVYPKLDKLQEKVGKISDTNSADSDPDGITITLRDVDNEMRELIDFVFDSNVSEVCASEGSMYDPIDGMFRFEYIMDALMKLYDTNLTLEFNKMKSRINKYAKKK